MSGLRGMLAAAFAALVAGATLAQTPAAPSTPATTDDPAERVLVELLSRDRARNFAMMEGEFRCERCGLPEVPDCVDRRPGGQPVPATNNTWLIFE